MKMGFTTCVVGCIWGVYTFCPRLQSVLGGFLDPLADKIMVATVALALGREGIMPEPLVVKNKLSYASPFPVFSPRVEKIP